jgi:NADPH:quinone reductase-like Zn-dependent oxidoreductase
LQQVGLQPLKSLKSTEHVALNPVDWMIQKAGIFIQDYPAVIGSDSSGQVVQVGEGVSNFKSGDRVSVQISYLRTVHGHHTYQGWFLTNDGATHQQFSIHPAEILAKIPDEFSFEDAATIPLGLATAAVGLYNPLQEGGLGLKPSWTPEGKGFYKNQPIVILGGSSSVGQFAIQLAKLSGFSPIITTSSKKHTDFLKSLGATHVVDRASINLASDIKFFQMVPPKLYIMPLHPQILRNWQWISHHPMD